MPEYPDVEVYCSALRERVEGEVLHGVRLRSPSLLRTHEPPLRSVHGRRVVGVERLGKRIVLALEEDLFLVVHLMIAGRFQWKAPGAKVPVKRCHGAFDFDAGTLLLTEASTHKRASLHVVRGRAALAALDPGGLEVPGSSLDAFRAALTRANHTVKRALCDPTMVSGVGNAYSDEILHRARLSPAKWTTRLDDEEMARLHAAAQEVLVAWRDLLEEQRRGAFPSKVTAFRPEMAVHGKFGQPCPVCDAPVQRIVTGEREANYCARCQTGGRLLADRVLSRLLHDDWPRTLDD